MNRKQFLLSLPLIGGAIKAIADREPVTKPQFDVKKLTARKEELNRLYPFTKSECCPPEWVKHYQIVRTNAVTKHYILEWENGSMSKVVAREIPLK